jgi:hypothetical protein
MTYRKPCPLKILEFKENKEFKVRAKELQGVQGGESKTGSLRVKELRRLFKIVLLSSLTPILPD